MADIQALNQGDNKSNKQNKVDAVKLRSTMAEIEQEGNDYESSAKAILAMLTSSD